MRAHHFDYLLFLHFFFCKPPKRMVWSRQSNSSCGTKKMQNSNFLKKKCRSDELCVNSCWSSSRLKRKLPAGVAARRHKSCMSQQLNPLYAAATVECREFLICTPRKDDLAGLRVPTLQILFGAEIMNKNTKLRQTFGTKLEQTKLAKATSCYHAIIILSYCHVIRMKSSVLPVSPGNTTWVIPLNTWVSCLLLVPVAQTLTPKCV